MDVVITTRSSPTPICFLSKLRRCLLGGMPSLCWAWKQMALPVNVFAKICMPARNRNRPRGHNRALSTTCCRPFQDNCVDMVTLCGCLPVAADVALAAWLTVLHLDVSEGFSMPRDHRPTESRCDQVRHMLSALDPTHFESA